MIGYISLWSVQAAACTFSFLRHTRNVAETPTISTETPSMIYLWVVFG
jgi:hypothetical protein